MTMLDCPCAAISRNLSISVAFSSHCYTKSFDPAEHDWEQVTLHDGAGKPRVLCPIRHGLSFRLPDMVTALPGAKVFLTPAQKNYVYSVPLDLAGQSYEMFFMLHRVNKAAEDLRMTVQSAYPMTTPAARRKRPSAIRFPMLAYKVYRGEPVRFAPR